MLPISTSRKDSKLDSKLDGYGSDYDDWEGIEWKKGISSYK
jgi:hypothetical protein